MWTRRLLSLSLTALVILACGVSILRVEAADRQISVAAAADLSFALQEVAAGYDRRA